MRELISKVLLLNSLLEDCNIDAKPVLISTRNNGFATKVYPVMSDFNYLIVQVKIGAKTFFLDAAEASLPFGSLPFRCLNGYGRVIDFKEGSKWVDIEVKNMSQLAYRLEIDIKNDSLEATVGVNKTGYYAIDAKRDFNKNQTQYKKAFLDNYPLFDILEHTVEPPERNDLIFKETLHLKQGLEPITKTAEGVTKKTYYINPILFTLFKKNPFTLQQRSYPIYFGYKNTYT